MESGRDLHAPPRNCVPEPTPDAKPWFNSKGVGWTQSSDLSTEREYRPASRLAPSSQSQTRNFPGPNGQRSPDGRDGRVSVSETATTETPPIPYWSAKRHLTCGNPIPGPPWSSKNIAWRGSAPGKLKTANAALVLCLNIDVDPPDIVKTNPCAVLECWVDPHTMPSHTALESIGSNIKIQFEGLSLKIAYKPILDPSLEDLRRFCQTLRKQAKDDAVLFYYNGHGVPKPTASGELWCFNRTYTQYIPVSIQEVQGWLGSPGVYVWDCSAAGHLLQNFNIYAERRDHEVNMLHGGYPEGAQPMMNSIQLAACGANEHLPSCPELPADIFTSCLTSPIDVAVRYFIMNHQLPNNITADMVVQLPGDLKDRRTPLGELNWVFTAITDTIAWTTFSRETFTRLYRCDLLIASLFRNFLLAERIMKNYHCTPHTYPSLPATNTHPLWATWDLALDTCLRQLPDLLVKSLDSVSSMLPSVIGSTPGSIGSTFRNDPNPLSAKQLDKTYVYVPSRFFADQLTAFEVWISRGGSALTKPGPLSLPQASIELNGFQNYDSTSYEHHLVPRKPPDQLPIVLQVLLSQPHRLRALILLSQFVDLGPWAVHLVLTIGIFPYISKLLQAAGQDLRPVLIFIWARILAVDSSVQTDLYNTQGYKYFATVLGIKNEDNLPNSSEHKAMCSFILASISRDFPHGQAACWSDRVFDNCYERLDDPDFLLRQWTALCIAQMWDCNDEIKVYGVDRGTQDKLIGMLADDSTEVRAAALYALGTFMGASGSADPNKQGGGGTGTMYQLEERVHFRMEVAVATGATIAIKDDASPMCRKELLTVISCLVKEWRGYFVICAWLYWEEDRKWRSGATGTHHPLSSSHLHDDDVTSQAIAEWLEAFGEDDLLREENRVLLSSFFTIFVVLLDLSVDPYQEVATNAQTIVDYITALLLESPFSRLDSASLNYDPAIPLSRRGSPQLSCPPPHPFLENELERSSSKSETMTNSLSIGVAMKRTASFANSLKIFAGNIAFPTSEDGHSSPTLHSAQLRSDRQGTTDLSRPPSPNMNIAQYASPYAHPQSGSTPAEKPNTSSPRHSQESSSNKDYIASDVMDALMEEDMERLRARRRTASHSRRHHAGGSSPSNSTFSMDSTNSSVVILGLGTGVGIRDVLPLKSSFFDWCAEYFKDPQMRQTEADEPGSVQYNYQVWRQQRNDHIIKDTQAQAPVAETCSWERPVATLFTTGHPLTMAFHSFDKQLVIANESDMISVYDWNHRKRLNYFCNGNYKGTSITALDIINQDVGGIIMTGSADGIVRLFRNYDPTLEQGPLQMVSSFRGLNEVIQMQKGCGLVFDWKQTTGSLLVGGDSRVIKVWDAQTETQSLDLDTNSESPVTAIVSEGGSSQTFLASFADGVVKVFDRRLEEENAVVRSYSDHAAWVQNVRWHPKLAEQFISASLDGQVKLFDLRGADIAYTTWDLHPKSLSAFDVHPISGVFATTSAINHLSWKSQRLVVRSLVYSEPPLSTSNIPTGLSAFPFRGVPSPFIPRHTSLSFHPTEMLYALGGPDGTVRIMGCNLP